GHFFVGNMLLGLGSNFAFVGGTTLLTTTNVPSGRAKVQGSHDSAVYGTTATAAALSGVLHANAGWTVENNAALPLMGAVLLGVLWLSRVQARSSVAAAS